MQLYLQRVRSCTEQVKKTVDFFNFQFHFNSFFFLFILIIVRCFFASCLLLKFNKQIAIKVFLLLQNEGNKKKVLQLAQKITEGKKQTMRKKLFYHLIFILCQVIYQIRGERKIIFQLFNLFS